MMHTIIRRAGWRVTRLLLLGWLLTVSLVAGTYAVALAHANLARSEPSSNAVLARSPSEVRAWFTEAPEPKFSQLTVTDSAGNHVDTGDTRPMPGDPLGLAITLQPDLPEGVYTVGWKTLSAVDGHETRGLFAFAV